MTPVLTQPLGLLALISLPLIVWLHRHVLRGERREVSSLSLWTPRDDPTLEGRTRARPPLTLVLWLELAAAGLLSLLLAGFDLRLPGAPRPHLGIALDATASMAGGPAGETPLDAARRALDELAEHAPPPQVSIVLAGEAPRLLGETRSTPQAARAALDAFTPTGGSLRLAPALEMLAGLGVAPDDVLIVSDDPELAHRRLWRVGRPAPNVGFSAAHWRAGAAPFVAVRRFDDTPRSVELVIERDGDASPKTRQRQRLELTAQREVALSVPAPEGVQRVELRLPDDALVLDNRVTLLRPPARAVGVHAAVETEPLRAALARAIEAVPLLEAAPEAEADLRVRDDGAARAPAGRWLLAFAAGAGRPRLAEALTADPFSPLTAGLDVHGLTWITGGQPPALDADADAEVLLAAPHGPLVWRRGRALHVTIDLARSNLLAHSAFPVLLANLAQEIDRAAGGLARRSYLQGERLTLVRAATWRGPIEVRGPGGEPRRFTADERTLPLGALAAPGLYRLTGEGIDERFAVSFVATAESDLQRRGTPGERPALRFASARGRDASLRPWLLLLAAAGLGTAFWLLSKGRAA